MVPADKSSVLDPVACGAEERFAAAVKVIQTLPADGSFKPSREMMLRFYALYKQATEGPCSRPKPHFYEATERAKWEAYKSVESVTKEAAMEQYVGELKKIIEMMSLTPEVSDFLDKLGSFYELVNDKENVPDFPTNDSFVKHQAFNGNSSDAVRAALNIVARSSDSRVPQLQIKDRDGSSGSDDEDENVRTDIFHDIQESLNENCARRDSMDSFKSQSELPFEDAEDAEVKPSIPRTTSAEVDDLKKRLHHLEELCWDQAKRLRAAEGNIELLAQEQACRKNHSEKLRSIPEAHENTSFESQNRLVQLLHRFWNLLETRLRRFPVISTLFAIIWPIVLQVVGFLIRKLSLRRPRSR